MKTISDFDSSPKCPKCDNDCSDANNGVAINVTYCDSLGVRESCKGWKGEHKGDHLHITCGRCNYVWIMTTSQDHTTADEEERANPNKDFSESCIMCDEKRLKMVYCSKSGNLPECTKTPLPKEHLHMDCELCGATYMTKTSEDADFDADASEESGELGEESPSSKGRVVTVVGEEEEHEEPEEKPSRRVPR
jgi:hypothetical protein